MGVGVVAPRTRKTTMLDLIYIGLTLLFFGLSWALVRGSEGLR
jgi:hypothetical protein